jgi:5,6,7,8-tetrahydromethanopterin hydro-lyase
MIQLGEAYVGDGKEAAHLNTVLGDAEGPAGHAWATSLATPSAGHVAFVVIAQPNLPVKPMTLFVNKATIASEQHARLTWGPAQLGVASGVLDAVADGTIPADAVGSLVLIAAVWVDPAATDADRVYEFNRQATADALRHGATGQPDLADVLAVRDTPLNGYYVPATLRDPST